MGGKDGNRDKAKDMWCPRCCSRSYQSGMLGNPASLPYRPEAALWTSVVAQRQIGSHHLWVLTTSRQVHYLLLNTCRACDCRWAGLCHQCRTETSFDLWRVYTLSSDVSGFYFPFGCLRKAREGAKATMRKCVKRHSLCLSKTCLRDTVGSFFSDS